MTEDQFWYLSGGFVLVILVTLLILGLVLGW